MGAFGTAFVGAVIGVVALWLHPMRPFAVHWTRTWPLMAVTAAVAALVAKYAGNLSGLFLDGQLLEWSSAVLAAIVAATLVGVGLRDKGHIE
ncbi:MAG: hypothetical protein ACRYG5_19025 [Janthinobacterium lividum]